MVKQKADEKLSSWKSPRVFLPSTPFFSLRPLIQFVRSFSPTPSFLIRVEQTGEDRNLGQCFNNIKSLPNTEKQYIKKHQTFLLSFYMKNIK